MLCQSELGVTRNGSDGIQSMNQNSSIKFKTRQ